ncbi:MAG: glycosyltransferase, partial [Alphaproteobacteria bacterium]
LKAVQLDWVMPKMPKSIDAVAADKPRIVFPASTLARKGAYELREALQDLDVTLVVAGASQHEGADFWHGLDVEPRRAGANLFAGASLVVLPALVEHAPRAILRALASGIPAVASRECGIGRRPGLATVAAGDATALRSAILIALYGEPQPQAKAA